MISLYGCAPRNSSGVKNHHHPLNKFMEVFKKVQFFDTPGTPMKKNSVQTVCVSLANIREFWRWTFTMSGKKQICLKIYKLVPALCIFW